MQIKELQEFVRDFERVSIAEMKLYLQIDRPSLNLLLERLVQKGVVQKSATAEECETCQKKCDNEEIEFYEWVQSA